ncbi:hypothetical protein LCGC14_0619320 [marine sediment metagenome]|uniref:Uncharacterized protein n=1 Tax=marine sediment metagenome TaxID=412755 RepID=A0A0F9R584_9ZZZZ|nr:hypothetical protein [Actinomycetota bacterium]
MLSLQSVRITGVEKAVTGTESKVPSKIVQGTASEKPATPGTPSSYKVGDKVRVTRESKDMPVTTRNHLGEVREISRFEDDDTIEDTTGLLLPIESLEPVSAYVPAVGDVVSFEYCGKTHNGVVFDDGDSLSLANNQAPDYTYVNTAAFIHSSYGLSKIGYIDKVIGIKSRYAIAKIAKAYFSALTGTYAEKQAQWIEHHGIKAGDKVKVVRKFEDGENDWTDKSPHKSHPQVDTEHCIDRIDDDGIETSWNGGRVPYFALEPVK